MLWGYNTQDILERASRQDEELLHAWLPSLKAELARLLPEHAGTEGSRTQASQLTSLERPQSTVMLRGLTLLAEAQLPKDVKWLPENLQRPLPQMCDILPHICCAHPFIKPLSFSQERPSVTVVHSDEWLALVQNTTSLALLLEDHA